MMTACTPFRRDTSDAYYSRFRASIVKLLDTWLDELMPLVECHAHIFEPEPAFGAHYYRCARCGRMAVEEGR